MAKRTPRYFVYKIRPNLWVRVQKSKQLGMNALLLEMGSNVYQNDFDFIFNTGVIAKPYSRVQKTIENWSVFSKMALGEVGVSLS